MALSFSRLAGWPPDRYLTVTTQGKFPPLAGNLPKSHSHYFQTYLTVTLAPTSSSFFLAASESALLAPSSTGLGAPSTNALASARPSPALTSRTALITAIFLSAGTDSRITSNAVFTSAAGAVAAP